MQRVIVLLLSSSLDCFSYLTMVARTSHTMLNEHGESRHLYPVPDVRGHAFTYWPLSKMLTVLLSYLAWLNIEVYVFYFHIVKSFFVLNKCWFCQNLFLHLLRWPFFIFYCSLCLPGVSGKYWFVNIVLSFHLWDGPNLIMM